MFVKLLSAGDIIAALLVLLAAVGFLPAGALKYAGFWLIIKGLLFLLFSRDFASMVDVLIGAYLLASYAGIYSSSAIVALAVVWLLQKSVLGML